jgi:hypothetical protein
MEELAMSSLPEIKEINARAAANPSQIERGAKLKTSRVPKLDILAEQRAKRNFQRTGNCCRLIVHYVACLTFDSGNCAAVKQDSLPSQSARKVVLADWRTRLEPRPPNLTANQISLPRFSCLFHCVRNPHA